MSRVETNFKSTFFPVQRTITTPFPSGWYNIGDISDTLFSYPNVKAIAVDRNNGLIYVGGQFTRVNDLSASNVAVYNTNTRTWSDLNGGTDYEVRCMVVDLSGNVVLGGNFSAVGPNNLQVNYIAKYVPSSRTWLDISGGAVLTNSVDNMVLDSSNNVYFSSGNYLWKHVTSTGATVNPIIPFTQFNAQINSIGIDMSNNIFVGGGYTNIFGTPNVPRTSISKWTPINDVSLSLSTDLSGQTKFPNTNVWSITGDLSNNVYMVASNKVVKYLNTGNSFETGDITINGGRVFQGAVDASNNFIFTGNFSSCTPATNFTPNGATITSKLISVAPNLAVSAVPGGDISGTTYYDAYSVATDGNNIIVGGDFERIGSLPAQSIAENFPNGFVVTTQTNANFYFNAKSLQSASPKIN